MPRPRRSLADQGVGVAQAIDSSGPGKRYRIWLVVAGWSTVAVIQAVALDASGAVSLEFGFPASILSHAVMGIVVWRVWRAHARLELWKRGPLYAVSVHVAVGVGALAVWGAAEAAFARSEVRRELLASRLCTRTTGRCNCSAPRSCIPRRSDSASSSRASTGSSSAGNAKPSSSSWRGTRS